MVILIGLIKVFSSFPLILFLILFLFLNTLSLSFFKIWDGYIWKKEEKDIYENPVGALCKRIKIVQGLEEKFPIDPCIVYFSSQNTGCL